MSHIVGGATLSYAMGEAAIDTKIDFIVYRASYKLMQRRFGPKVALLYTAGGIGAEFLPNYTLADIVNVWQNPEISGASKWITTGSMLGISVTKDVLTAPTRMAEWSKRTLKGNKVCRLIYDIGAVRYSPEMIFLRKPNLGSASYWYFYRTGQLLTAKPEIEYHVSNNPIIEEMKRKGTYDSLGLFSKIILNEALDERYFDPMP